MKKQKISLSAGKMSADYYHYGRLNKKSFIYRLKRRGNEIIGAIKKYAELPLEILDLGTADGLMLSRIKNEFPDSNCLGIELSEELAKSNNDDKIKIIVGDAQKTNLSGEFFNVVICSALICHIPDSMVLIKEAKRLLKKDGIIIITAPVPFFEKIGRIFNLLDKKEDYHFELYNLKELNNLLNKAGGFTLLEQKRFMISPTGIPCEKEIEKILYKLHLNFLMLNQLVVARKN